ncbi:MAG: Nif3-like dinuclear metal center hexameric protein [Deltaproteobacteria bacterium]|nr:MAG: Nif3-like dinuclear metal center hexameric protein [Deltaproteobacteria bacterium]
MAKTDLPLKTLTTWLEELLEPTPIEDYGPNGLQVEACDRVSRVVTGVTANLDLIEAARDFGADLLVVHHGLYWTGAPYTVTGALGRRIRTLIDARMSLVGYHLPLDGHPEVGNAVNLARTLGLVDLEPAFEHHRLAVGCIGHFPEPVAADEVGRRLGALSDRLLYFPHGPDPIRSVGVVTGGAPRDVREAIDQGLDLYITGEAGEYSQATAREERINFAALGHHRSERFGPEALAERMAEAFPELTVRFIDVDNPA